MYKILGTYGDEVTGTRNDGGQDDLSIVYELLGVYKMKWKVTFRSEIETNGEEKMPEVAPGAKEDLEAHARDYLTLEPVGADEHYEQEKRVVNQSSRTRSKMCMGGSKTAPPRMVTSE